MYLPNSGVHGSGYCFQVAGGKNNLEISKGLCSHLWEGQKKPVFFL